MMLSPVKTDKGFLNEENLPFIYFITQGVSALVSWNVILSTLDYYHQYFPDGEVEFLLPASYSVTILIINFLMVYIKRNFSLDFRVSGCLLIQGILLVLLPIVAAIFAGTKLGFWLIIIIVCLIGVIHQIPQASVVGLAGYLEPKYMAYQQMGTGFGGIIPNIIRIITLSLFTSDSESHGVNLVEIFFYYTTSFAYLCFCMYIHSKFMNSKFAEERILNINSPEFEQALLATEMVAMGSRNELADPERKKSESTLIQAPSKGTENMFAELWITFKKIRFFAILLFILYVQTLSFFPGVMLKRDVPGLAIAWKVVLMEFAYNIMDTIGKGATMYHGLLKKKLAAGLIAFRVFLCAVFVIQAVPYNIPILGSLWFDFVNIALFGLTNGLITSIIFVLGPDSVEGEYKEFAGFVLLNSLSSGIMIGSFVAIPLANI